MDNFSERVRYILYKYVLSQSEAARRCGISQQAMNYIIKNNLKSSKLALQIADGLNVNSEWLISGIGHHEQKSFKEIPLFNNYFSLEAFRRGIPGIVTDYFYTDSNYDKSAFAYQLDQSRLAICCQEPPGSGIVITEYLYISSDETKITTIQKDNCFLICEWRIKNVINH